ncbi:hypothetical protein AOLI_G00172100 [Acnodon oligacanthus]
MSNEEDSNVARTNSRAWWRMAKEVLAGSPGQGLAGTPGNCWPQGPAGRAWAAHRTSNGGGRRSTQPLSALVPWGRGGGPKEHWHERVCAVTC